MEWLKYNYENYPERPFLNEMTYKEVYKQVVVLAEKISALTKTEVRVAIYADNAIETAVFILALLLIKKEVLLLNVHLKKKEVKRQLDILNVRTVFSSGDEYVSFDQVYRSPQISQEFDWSDDPDRIAVIMNTSATTGTFKSVPIRWKQIFTHVQASAEVLGVKANDNWLLLLPLFHISGLSILFRTLYNGTAATIRGKFEESDVLELLETKKINMVSLVPTILSRIVDKIDRHCLRVILLGGEFIPSNLIQKCIHKALPVYKTYGMTEMTSQSTTFCILDHPDKLESVGKPLPQTEVIITNADQEGVGEIRIKSPMLMSGYIGRSDIEEYFNTKDIGYLDRDGFLFILNRRADIIISGGENIYPKEIENLLYQLPQVKECAVVGVPDDAWGQKPILYLVSDVDQKFLEQYLAANLAVYKLPKQIIYLKELPKNETGKIRRNVLQRESL